MKLSKFVAGAAALALVSAASSAAFADGHGQNNNVVFNVNGTVDASCIVSFTSTNVSLGDIPVNTTASAGYQNYFHMTQSSTGNGVAGQGGCNTSNHASLTESNQGRGLHNNTNVAYNPGVFTQDLQYSAELSWFGPYETTGGPDTAGNPTLANGLGQGSSQINSGAWASQMSLWVNVPQNSKGLLAGTYADSLTFTIAPNV